MLKSDFDKKNEEAATAEESKRESAFIYPCKFPLKIIGVNCPEFRELVLATLFQKIPDFNESWVDARPSLKGAYISLHLEFIAESREQVDQIYLAFNHNPLVKCVL